MRVIIIVSALLSAAVSQAQTWSRTMRHLPDAGQTASFTATPGEDADFSIYPLSYSVHGDGTLTDDVTGLMWQVVDGGEMTIEGATAYADSLQLAGYSDWRLPSAHELMSIQDLQMSNPSIDTQSFAPTEAEYWWSADAQANDPNKIWVTNAGGGIGNHPKTETVSAGGTHRFHARAVRSVDAPVEIQTRFITNGDGTVTDALTDLIWQQNALADTITWEEALQLADTCTLAGFTDWRLPSIKEMHSISQENILNPSIDPEWSGVSEMRKWWSSTSLLNDPQKAWYLFSRYGITTYDYKTLRHHVLLVRGGEATSGIELPVQNELFFYPNPAHGVIYASHPTAQSIDVFDASGKYVRSFIGKQSWTIDALKPGAYFFRASGSTKSYPIVVE